MRSYTYSEGQWHPYKDTLPPTALEPHRLYSDAKEQQKWRAFADPLEKLGFSTQPSTYTCRFGYLRVYARDHSILPSARRASGDTHDFLCVLYLGGTYIRVWIAEMRELSLFFTELETRFEDDALKEFLADETLRKMMGTITALADSLYEGYGSFTVKVESPNRR